MSKKKDLIKDRLQELSHNGRVTPEQCIEDAKSADSPLHGEFEWDDMVAGHKYRLAQARNLISSVKLIVKNETISLSTVCYVRDPSVESSEQGYISLTQLKTEEDLAREALVYEFTRANAALKRARDIAKALDMLDEVDSILENISILQDRTIEIEPKGLQ